MMSSSTVGVIDTSSRDSTLRSAQQSARELSRGCAVFKGDRTALDRVAVSARRLQETPTASRKIGDDARRGARRARSKSMTLRSARSPGSDQPSIEPSEVLCGTTSQLVHHGLERNARRVGTIPSPQRHVARGHAGVTDRTAVGTAVGEPKHRHGRRDHLAHGVEIAMDEVEQRRVDQLASLSLQLHVVGVLARVDTQTTRRRAERLRRRQGRS